MMQRQKIMLIVQLLIVLSAIVTNSAGQEDRDELLTPTFYDETCRNAQSIVYHVVRKAVKKDKRMAASLLRMHFHDCFVNGCDGSVLLDDTQDIIGEKTAAPNANSLRGFKVIDKIKRALEKECPGVVSCADILTIAAQISVTLRSGPSWTVYLGRRDSLSASNFSANNDIPPPTSNVSTLVQFFSRQGLTLKDMVVLSGSHTIGLARCTSFKQRVYDHSGTHRPDPQLHRDLLIRMRIRCPKFTDGNRTLPLDYVTPKTFDNFYFRNLMQNKGLLNSDQVLTYQSAETLSLVESFSYDQQTFLDEFPVSMVRMGNIKPLTGTRGEIRRNCHFVNSYRP